MKCVCGKQQKVLRLPDREAAKLVEQGQGWKYISKAEYLTIRANKKSKEARLTRGGYNGDEDKNQKSKDQQADN